jgi:hypothetical protein
MNIVFLPAVSLRITPDGTDRSGPLASQTQVPRPFWISVSWPLLRFLVREQIPNRTTLHRSPLPAQSDIVLGWVGARDSLADVARGTCW